MVLLKSVSPLGSIPATIRVSIPATIRVRVRASIPATIRVRVRVSIPATRAAEQFVYRFIALRETLLGVRAQQTMILSEDQRSSVTKPDNAQCHETSDNVVRPVIV